MSIHGIQYPDLLVIFIPTPTVTPTVTSCASTNRSTSTASTQRVEKNFASWIVIKKVLAPSAKKFAPVRIPKSKRIAIRGRIAMG